MFLNVTFIVKGTGKPFSRQINTSRQGRLLQRGEPLFVGKDVAKALGYAKPRTAINMHVDKDDALKQGLIDARGREQMTTLINESGLYSLILSSKLPQAR